MTDAEKKVALRISLALHERIAALAKKNFRSINGQITAMLEESTAREESQDIKKKADRNA